MGDVAWLASAPPTTRPPEGEHNVPVGTAKVTARVRVFSAREALRMSLWFIPALSVTAAVGLAAGLIALDHRLPQARDWPLLFPGGAESARNLLSTIAAAMVTSISLIFSVTMVVLQLASAQYSPRVLRTFLRDRLVQAVLGVYLSTFVYSLLVLPSVTAASEQGPAFVPAVSVSVAVVLTLVSLGLFVRYIHHIAHSIRAVTVLRAVHDETRQSLDNLYPEEIGEAAPDVPLPSEEPTATVRSLRPGVMVAVDEDRLLDVAAEARLVVRIVPLMGDFVAEGAPVLDVWSPQPAVDGGALLDCIAFADERTIEQDAAFGFRQIVDIAERALSPGVNDPTTAAQAIDQLHDLLRRLVGREFPSRARVDRSGELRVIAPRLSWEDYVDLAFDEIRLYSGRSLQVVRRLRGALTDLVAAAPADRAGALERQLKLLDRDVTREFDDPLDRAKATRPADLS
jgi:uncharacterized membrane protein